MGGCPDREHKSLRSQKIEISNGNDVEEGSDDAGEGREHHEEGLSENEEHPVILAEVLWLEATDRTPHKMIKAEEAVEQRGIKVLRAEGDIVCKLSIVD